MNFPPACLFPTTTVVIDDDSDFLQSLQNRLKNRHTIIKAFENTKDAENFLIESGKQRSLFDDLITFGASDYCYENTTIEIQFNKILELSVNPQRFERITCIIIDYSMPSMNGLHFLQSCPLTNAKKILLTGYADATIGVEAINNGLIDYYVKKHDPDMPAKVKDLVTKIQHDYFRGLSLLIKNSMPLSRQQDAELHAEYCSLFNRIVTKNEVNEFYLADPNGSYVFFGNKGRTDLLIKSRDQLSSESESAKELLLDRNILDGLKNFDLMLVADSASPEKFLRAKPLSSKRTFFYSIE